MTFCELLIFTLVTGIVSGVISAYIDKNNRHESK